MRTGTYRDDLAALVRAIQQGDEASVEREVLRLGQAHRIFAPLTFAIGAVMILVQGLRVLITDWRLSLLQVLPATWIWAAMLDLKAHTLRGHDFNHWYGWPVLLAIALVALITMAGFHLNVVFAFAVLGPQGSRIRPAFGSAREHLGLTLIVGGVTGLALGVSALIVPRWGQFWFSLSMSIVIAIMMLTYVAVPARLIGGRRRLSRRDKLTASVVSGAVGAVVCAPGYILGRVGILLLGSKVLFVVGVVMVAVGFALQAGANGAVKAVKISSKLIRTDPQASG